MRLQRVSEIAHSHSTGRRRVLVAPERYEGRHNINPHYGPVRAAPCATGGTRPRGGSGTPELRPCLRYTLEDIPRQSNPMGPPKLENMIRVCRGSFAFNIP